MRIASTSTRAPCALAVNCAETRSTAEVTLAAADPADPDPATATTGRATTPTVTTNVHATPTATQT